MDLEKPVSTIRPDSPPDSVASSSDANPDADAATLARASTPAFHPSAPIAAASSPIDAEPNAPQSAADGIAQVSAADPVAIVTADSMQAAVEQAANTAITWQPSEPAGSLVDSAGDVAAAAAGGESFDSQTVETPRLASTEAITEASIEMPPADAAVSTADASGSTADAAVSTADAGVSTADAGVSTADAAGSTADAGGSTADAAVSTADAGVSTADAGVSTADAGVSTADASALASNEAVAAVDAVVAAAGSSPTPNVVGGNESTIPNVVTSVAVASPNVSAESSTAPVSSADLSSVSQLSATESASLAKQIHDDAVAKQRGVTPIRVPSHSKRYEAVREPIGSSSRGLLLGAIAVAAVCVAVTVGVIVWARGAVSRAEQAANESANVTGKLANPAPAPSDSLRGADSLPSASPPGAELPPSAEPPSVDSPPAGDSAPGTPPTGTGGKPAAGSAPIATPDGECTVSVRSRVRDARVWIDGKQHGIVPVVVPVACNSTATVEVRHPRYADFKEKVDVTASHELDAKLEREQTMLTVWSQPSGATVTYNGKTLGETPLVVPVNRFEQGHVYFRLNGYETDWRRIVPKELKKTVSITLKKTK